MTDSKTPTANRTIQPESISSSPAAPGPPYSAGQFQILPTRAKLLNPVSHTTGTSSTIQHSLNAPMSTVATHFQVPLQSGTTKPLTVVTSYKTNPVIGSSATVMNINHASIEKVTSSPVDGHIKANVKSVPMTKVSYMKQITATVTKAAPLMAGKDQTKKDHIIKARPVLLGQGLRQPNSQHPAVAKQNAFEDSVITPRTRNNTSPWVIHQQDVAKTIGSNASVVKMKAPFPNNIITAGLPHDLSKKHSVSQQSKSTMPTLANLSSTEAVHRNAALTLSTSLSSGGNKSIYQVVAPNLSNSKKLSAMIVTQAISLASTNSNSTATGYIPSVLASKQITVMTCDSGITYVPAPTPPNGTSSTSIPIAKVYPQQQPMTRVSVASAPAISSISPATSTILGGSTAALTQVSIVKSTPTTSTVMTTHHTIVSKLPVSTNKSVANIGGGSVFCWPSYSTLPLSTVISGATAKSNLTVTSASSQPGNNRTHSVLLVDNQRTAHLQATVVSVPSVLQVSDTARGTASHNSTNSPGMGSSPKPAILRRQRPDNTNVLRKLSYTTAPNFQNQKRDVFHSKPAERRPAPYTISRPNSEIKTNEILHVHTSGQSDKNEIKPVLANQVYSKPVIPSNGFPPLKISSMKPHTVPFPNTGKDGGQTFSIHPSVNIDLKVKMEPSAHSLYPTSAPQNLVKSESSSASKMLHFQNITMHSYAAESPQTSSAQPPSISQASGQHIRTNTIFAKQMTHPHLPGPQKPKSSLIKPGSGAVSSANRSTPPAYFYQSNHGFSLPNRRVTPDNDRTMGDHIKKEQMGIPVLGQIRNVPNTFNAQLNNHNLPNHLISPISPAKWSNINSNDPITGLSPRKRPRKQTHIVSEDPPDVVMEDEESTDDADECEDEPIITQLHNAISATPAVKLPGHKPNALLPQKVEPQSNKRILKKEVSNESSKIKTEPSISPINNEAKVLSEYTDHDGVRYVATRKRPAVSVLNRLKPNPRTVANHYMRYSDIRPKEKKSTLGDLESEKKRAKGIKVARLAFQLQDMVECEKDVWQRMQQVYNGLVTYKSSLVSDATFDSTLASPSPGTPTSLSNSFRKATPRSKRSSSMPQVSENGALNSPSTPLDRRTNKVNDEILIIEELAQANLQRCRVVSDQLIDTKTILLKSVDHRQMVTDILDSSSNQKTQTHSSSVTTQSTKRMSKKKTNS